MRLHGYCDECRCLRQVRVSGHALAMAGARRGIVHGICSECEQKQDERRRGKFLR